MKSPIEKEKILDEFAAELSHGRDTLDRYISKYPEIRLELLELAAEFRLVSDEGRLASEKIEDPGAVKAWELFSSLGTNKHHASNPFSCFNGRSFAELSDRLGVPRGFMVGIRDKRVRLKSIPDRFLSATSKAMDIAIDELRTYLSGEPKVLSTAEFKADKKPMVVEQVTFEQLIADTKMSDVQRKRALEYLDNDRSD